MILYQKSKSAFIADVRTNRIEQEITAAFIRNLRRRPSRSEVRSWSNSLQFMRNVVDRPELVDDLGVAIEFTIPLTSRRVDFILTGQSAEGQETAVIVELKQWSEVEATELDAVVRTRIGPGRREMLHPSYQAWSYAALIRDYNETVREESIALIPCAYLHNLDSDAAINDARYAEHTERAPVFLHADTERFGAFLGKNLPAGDQRRLMHRIENGRLRPSKSLVDVLKGLLDGQPEFRLIDDQKLVYETALAMAADADREKQVLIVSGGPGTGKSVVAINLLVELTARGGVVQYVSRNAAPREVYKSVLKGHRTRNEIDGLFRGTGGFASTPPDLFDVLVVDEAHRMTEKSGFYGNEGENQVAEVMNAARLSVFFIDEDQRVTLADIGTREEIRGWAAEHGAVVRELELPSQFRCNGSDGYLAFLDDALGIRETAHPTIDQRSFDLRVFDDPVALWDRIRELNAARNKARLVAGYCWPWLSKKDPGAWDIALPEFGFQAQWNLATDGSLWIAGDDTVEQVGCIHTCQGLELDHVGVIIGPDLLARDGRLVTDGFARASQDRTIRGFKSRMKSDPEGTTADVDRIIRNTYRTLMSRGMRGCYLFSADEETRAYFRDRIEHVDEQPNTGRVVYPVAPGRTEFPRAADDPED